jgi:hypothetical protein
MRDFLTPRYPSASRSRRIRLDKLLARFRECAGVVSGATPKLERVKFYNPALLWAARNPSMIR